MSSMSSGAVRALDGVQSPGCGDSDASVWAMSEVGGLKGGCGPALKFRGDPQQS